jgi:predicted TIM-barrel enzyme
MDAANIEKFLPSADAFIVGSAFKRGGHWTNAVDAAMVGKFIKSVERASRHAR